MASDGLGKIKNKKSKDAGKPYDRPKSLFGKVHSTLKDLLTPTWILESIWQSTVVVPSDDEEEEVEEEEVVMEDDEAQEVVTDVTEDQMDDGRPAHGSRIRAPSDLAESSVETTDGGIVVECDGYQATFDPSILAEDRNLGPGVESTSSITRPPLSSACGDFAFAVPRSETQPSTSCGSSGLSYVNYGSSVKRGAPPLHSGDESFSDASETIQPEKAGAPTKKRCIERNNIRTAFVDQQDEEPVKGTSSRKVSGAGLSFLWHTGVNPLSASGSSCSVSRLASSSSVTGAAAGGRKPGFDLTAFCNSMNHSFKQGQQNPFVFNLSYQQSPYYSGKTTYGGASARSKPVKNETDCQVVKAVRHQVKRIKQGANVTSESTLSATAKRILQGLNTSEQQQQDDATVPYFNSSQADSPLSFTPTTYKRYSLRSSGSKNQLPPKVGPPVHEMQAPTVAIIKQSIQMYQGRQPDKSVVRWSDSVDQNVSKSSASAHVNYGLPSAAPSTQAPPGKMRREQTRKHYSNRTAEREDEMPMVVDLPTIPLPVKNLKPFTSDMLSTSSAGFFGSSGGKTEPGKAMTFTFSEPMVTSSDSDTNNDVQHKSFHFHSPIDVDNRHSNRMLTSSSQQPAAPTSAGAPSEPTSKSPLALKFNVNMAVKKAQPSSETASLGFAPAAELRQGSVMDLLGRPPNSSASKMTTSTSSSTTSLVTEPVSAVTSTAKPLSELFKSSGNTWNCPDCMAQNENSRSECPCCGAKKPGGSKTDVQPSTNSVGLTGDASSKPKEELAKNKEVPTSSGLPSLSSLFKKPPGEWVCPTCSVPNKEDQLKCCACEELKPGAKKPGASNGAVSPAPATAPSAGQVEAQGFKFNPAVFGSSVVSQSVSSTPPSADGTGIAPSGGFKMNLPSGSFSGFGSGGFSIPQSSSDKKDSAPMSGGFKPTMGFANFGQVPSSNKNGPSTKPEAISFLPPASSTTAKGEASSAAPSSARVQFGSAESKPGGFSFKPNVESETSSKAATVSFAFGASSAGPVTGGKSVESGFRFGEKVSSSSNEKTENNASGVLLRPPLRASGDKSNENFKLNSETNIDSSPQNNYVLSQNSSQATVGVFGSTPTAFDGTKFALPVTSTPLTFGVLASTAVVSTPAPLFGTAKPSTDVSASKFIFATTPGSTAVSLSGFGAPSTSLPIGVTQPVFCAPSSITSASIAPSVSAAGGFFVPPTKPVDKPAAQEAVKPAMFAFGQNPADAVPALFKFGQTAPVKEEAKPAVAANIFQFGQQSQITSQSNLFQFGTSSNITVSRPGSFNPTTGQSAASAGPVFGQPAAPATAPGMFGFGAGASTQTSSAGVFTFGAKPPDTASKPDVMPSFSQIGNKRSMDDDTVALKRGRSGSEDMPMQDVEPMQSPKQPSLGFPFNPQPSGFAFGTPQASAAVNNPGFFGAKPANPVSAFGNPSTAATPAAASPFAFTGQERPVPTPAPFGSQSISNMANGGANTGFTFGAGAAAPPPAPAAYNFSSTPNFNFSATPSNPSGNVTFNAQPSAVPPAGRTFKKAVRRANVRK